MLYINALGGMGLPQQLREDTGTTLRHPMAMYGDGVGLEGPWEAPRRVHVGVLTIVHATMMVTSTTFDLDILEGGTYPM